MHVGAGQILNLQLRDWHTPSEEVLASAKWSTLDSINEKKLISLAHKCSHCFYLCRFEIRLIKRNTRKRFLLSKPKFLKDDKNY